MTTAAVPRGNGEEAGPDGRSPKSVLGKVGHATRPVLENLAQALDSPVSLSVPNGSDLLCVDNAGRHRNRAGATVGGRRLQLHSTAPGKLTLALLPDQYPLTRPAPRMRRMTARTLTADRLPGELLRIQEQDYPTYVEEHRLGHSAVAVPVRGP